jgi:oxalate decarboxylase/phosphoglucose isomerase-like protein (cupin superfamily)
MAARISAAPVCVTGATAGIHPLHGGGAIRRLIYPGTVGSRAIFLGIAEVEPGQAPHVFHRHGTEVIGDLRLTYAPDFEEFYFVVEGAGLMQWREAEGRPVAEQPLAAGDAVYFPPGVMEHRIVNPGPGLLRVLYGGTPPASITSATEG